MIDLFGVKSDADLKEVKPGVRIILNFVKHEVYPHKIY
jgi:hypothetical protein